MFIFDSFVYGNQYYWLEMFFVQVKDFGNLFFIIIGYGIGIIFVGMGNEYELYINKV